MHIKKRINTVPALKDNTRIPRKIHLQNRARHTFKLVMFSILGLSLFSSLAHASDVYFVTQNDGGFGFSGKYDQIKKLYPLAYIASSSSAFKKDLLNHVMNSQPTAFNLKINKLSNHDKTYGRSIVLAMVLDGETESIEKYKVNASNVYKMDIQLHAETIFFDYARKTIIASVPISEQYIDTLDHYPTSADAEEGVRQALYLDPGNNLVSRFADSIHTEVLPKGIVKFVKVTKVKVSSRAMTSISNHPEMGWLDKDIAKKDVANQFSSAVEGIAKIPLEPYTIGSSTGKMAVAFSEDSAYNFTLPKPSYEIHLTLLGFKNVPYKSNPSGYSQIYGAFVHVKMLDSLVNKIYMNATFKNGVVKLIPKTQVTVAAGPAYLAALRGLFMKFATGLDNPHYKWIHSATTADNIQQMLVNTQKALESCKI